MDHIEIAAFAFAVHVRGATAEGAECLEDVVEMGHDEFPFNLWRDLWETACVWSERLAEAYPDPKERVHKIQQRLVEVHSQY